MQLTSWQKFIYWNTYQFSNLIRLTLSFTLFIEALKGLYTFLSKLSVCFMLHSRVANCTLIEVAFLKEMIFFSSLPGKSTLFLITL